MKSKEELKRRVIAQTNWKARNPAKAKASHDKWISEHPLESKAATARWRAAHLEQALAATAKWHIAHPGYATKNRESRLVKEAGRSRPKVCDLCKRPGKICFDHCHATGKFRGWLCHKCNITLGYVDDSPELLRKLAKYLTKARSAK